MKASFIVIPSLLALSLFSGCVSTPQNAEFVKTINFSSLDSFTFKHTLVTGLDFRESEELLLEELSEQAIVSELEGRGFAMDAEAPDFYVVVKWKKAVSSYPNVFDHVDGPFDSLNRRDNPSYRFSTRMHLTVEIYESSTRNLFWRNELPNIFDAVQLTEERIVHSLQRAIENFPEHIVKDPTLPSIE